MSADRTRDARQNKPLIIEIIGLPGSGKSTVADDLANRLTLSGAPALVARKRGATSVSGWLLAVGDTVTAFRLFRVSGASKKLAVRRTFHGVAAAATARAAGAAGEMAVIIREPGWAMQLVGAAIAEDLSISKNIAAGFLKIGETPDLLVVMPTDPETSMERARLRKRGMPVFMRGMSAEAVLTRFAAGKAACQTILDAAEDLGIDITTDADPERLMSRITPSP